MTVRGKGTTLPANRNGLPGLHALDSLGLFVDQIEGPAGEHVERDLLILRDSDTDIPAVAQRGVGVDQPATLRRFSLH